MESNGSSNKVHPLHTSWIIWYHNPNDKNWDMESYKSILEINTIEDYLALSNSWDRCLPKVTQGMFFFMRKFTKDKIIYPRWEDDHNKLGGYWSFKVCENKCEKTWDNLCKILIGESICLIDPNNINGISISPKKNFCIIKIWSRDSTVCDTDVLSEDLKSILSIDEVKYSSHNKNIRRDRDKVEKYKKRRDGGRHRMTRF